MKGPRTRWPSCGKLQNLLCLRRKHCLLGRMGLLHRGSPPFRGKGSLHQIIAYSDRTAYTPHTCCMPGKAHTMHTNRTNLYKSCHTPAHKRSVHATRDMTTNDSCMHTTCTWTICSLTWVRDILENHTQNEHALDPWV